MVNDTVTGVDSPAAEIAACMFCTAVVTGDRSPPKALSTSLPTTMVLTMEL